MFIYLLKVFIVITVSLTLCNGGSVLQTRFNGKYPSELPCRAGYFKVIIISVILPILLVVKLRSRYYILTTSSLDKHNLDISSR